MENSVFKAKTPCFEDSVFWFKDLALWFRNLPVLSKNSSGQMTIEFVVMFPVLILIALIATNALLFFSECASFDRVFRESVCVYSASPAYGSDVDESVGSVNQSLSQNFDHEFEEIEVSASKQGSGLATFSATLSFSPTLFGKGSITSIFGVALPKMTHNVQLTIDVYKPGIFI